MTGRGARYFSLPALESKVSKAHTRNTKERPVFVRKSAGIGFVIFVIAATASAQIPTGGNIFVGYSLSRTSSANAAVRLNGWGGSIERKFLPNLGIVADFGAGYGSDNKVFPNITCTVPCPFHVNSVRRSTYLFGPRVTIPRGRFTPFVHFLFGATHVKSRGVTETSFAIDSGFGFDIPLIRGLAWRLQDDGVYTRFSNTSVADGRLSTGVVFRF